MNEAGLTYEQSGVSIEAQDRAIEGFRERVERSHAEALKAGAGRVLAGVGSFGAAFAPNLEDIQQPVLISSTDGIGTKVRLHARFGTHAWAGRDLVAATVNDVLCQGARPLFFLDYFACNKVDPAVVEQVVGGMADICSEIGCALIGGEIAEMGDTYRPGEYDLAGCAIGLVDAAKLWGQERVKEGDVLVGIASSGVHCNGFSLIRRLFEDWPNADWEAERKELSGSLKDALLTPSTCYAGAVAKLAEFGLAGAVHAAAHISGGGLEGNLPRSIPAGLCAEVNQSSVTTLGASNGTIFDIIVRYGHVAAAEMWRVFNMGVGFVLVAEASSGQDLIEAISGHGLRCASIGKVTTSSGGSRFAMQTES